ncbi:MAG: agmatinase [Calditrichaeota bacterium]|nr:MAG: agmatinase [Calditrichota bacterium]
MRPDFLLPRPPYEGCVADLESADIVLVGAGYDGTASYRPGSRFAPIAIRSETLYAQENYSPYFQRDLTDKAIHDLGDIDLPAGNKTLALERIHRTARWLFDSGKRPVVIGGEHLITLPVVEAALSCYPELHLVQVDAHLDLMDELFGDRLSHGTVMRRIYERLGEPGRIYQVGIRSGSREEYQFAEGHTRLFPFTTREFIARVDQLRGKPVYLSLDVDVFDPSLIPGTGTPEAGGIFFPEFIDLLRALEPLNIVAADLVELAPQLDPTNVSTIVASKVLRELLIML